MLPLKTSLIVGGVASGGVATVAVSYVVLTNNKSNEGRKIKIGFENGECKYGESFYSLGSVGGDLKEENISDRNACLRLFNGSLDGKDVEIKWDNVPDKYKDSKEKGEKEVKNSTSEQK